MRGPLFTFLALLSFVSFGHGVLIGYLRMHEDLTDPEPKITTEKPKIIQENPYFDGLLPTFWFTFAQQKPKPKFDKPKTKDEVKNPEPKIKAEKTKLKPENNFFDGLSPVFWLPIAQEMENTGIKFLDLKELTKFGKEIRMILARRIN